jgi:hypothetical protein
MQKIVEGSCMSFKKSKLQKKLHCTLNELLILGSFNLSSGKAQHVSLHLSVPANEFYSLAFPISGGNFLLDAHQPLLKAFFFPTNDITYNGT